MASHDILYKGMAEIILISNLVVLILGNTGVGKTNLLSRWMTDSFALNIPPTVQVDFVTKSFHVKGKIIQVQFWDTGKPLLSFISYTIQLDKSDIGR